MAITTLTDDTFEQEVLKSDVPVLVDFWAEWCQPCKMVGPIVEEMAQAYEGKIKVGKMNVDENNQTAGSFGIMSIPTIMIFKKGQPVKSLVGAQGKAEYKRAIDEAIAS